MRLELESKMDLLAVGPKQEKLHNTKQFFLQKYQYGV